MIGTPTAEFFLPILSLLIAVPVDYAPRTERPVCRALPAALSLVFGTHNYNTARPHRAVGQLTPAQADTRPPEPIDLAGHRIRRKQVLGGLTHEYYVAALPPRAAAGNAGHSPESFFRPPQPSR